MAIRVAIMIIVLLARNKGLNLWELGRNLS